MIFELSGGIRVELRVDSAISLASMADAGDFYRGLVPVIEEDSVVLQRRRKPVFGGLSFFTSPVRLDR